MKRERDLHIDIMRCLGLLLVILAHIPINETIKQIRSFDVMLLVFVAGMSFSKSKKADFNYKQYLIGRVKRLCIPTWVCLIFIFGLAWILCLIMHKDYLYSFQQIMESIFFIGGINGGIGNVWIVRIYLLLAIMTPIYMFIERKLSDKQLIFLFVIILATNELIIKLFYIQNTLAGAIIENLFSSILGYSVGFLSGARLMKNKEHIFIRNILSCFIPTFLVCQVILCILGRGFSPNSYKYPPQLYYILYGCIFSLFIYMLCIKIEINNWRVRSVFVWISRKSFDIYLAHTIVLRLLSWGDKYIKNIFIFRVSLLYYMFVVLISFALVYSKDILRETLKRRK